MKKSHTKKLVLLGISIALTVVLQAIAQGLRLLGMTMSLALGIIPVLVISQIEDWKIGALAGAAFGLTSLVIAVIGAAAIEMYKVVINPLVSVFPRILVGIVSALVYSGLTRFFNSYKVSRKWKSVKSQIFVKSIISTVLGLITNTVLFLGMFLAFANGRKFGDLVINIKWVLSTIVAINTIIEIAVFTVIIPPIVFSLEMIRGKNLYKPSKNPIGPISGKDLSISTQTIESQTRNSD